MWISGTAAPGAFAALKCLARISGVWLGHLLDLLSEPGVVGIWLGSVSTTFATQTPREAAAVSENYDLVLATRACPPLHRML